MSDSSDKGRIYNKSIKSAYANLLMEKMGSGTKSAVYDDEDDELEEGELGMIQDNDDDDEYEGDRNSDYYGRFKRSILKDVEENDEDKISEIGIDDDRWLDDNSTLDEDYTDEADRSFYWDGDEQEKSDEYVESEGEGEDEGEEPLYYEDDAQPGMASKKWFKLVLALVFVVIVGPMISSFLTPAPAGIKPSAMPAIQKQINHLYDELSNKERRSKSDFDKTIKVVISQFEKKIKELLPSNVMKLQHQLESLTNKVNNLSLSLSQWEDRSVAAFSVDNVTEWQDQLIRELESQLPQEIPVVVNNGTSMLVLPELRDYLSRIVSSLAQHTTKPQDDQHLKYDLNSYVKEILADQFQYVDKDYFISELNRKIQLNKHEIFQEMNDKMQQWQIEADRNKPPLNTIPQQYSNILLKKLINHIYNTNQHQWEDDLDFATFAQGTKLLNHLTSSTWSLGNGISPVELLQDSRYSSSTYWQCGAAKGCSWAARFKEPVYLTRLSYIHGRFNNNLHMMDSAPKVISVYVKLAKSSQNVGTDKLVALAKSFKQGQSFSRDSQHIKIGQYHYSLTDNKIRQVLSLPSWFIQLKPLVRSIIFEVDENQGNKRFTSLRKFTINAVTQEDLQIMESNSFTLRSDESPEYASHSSVTASMANENEQPPQRRPAKDEGLVASKGKIPSFGQDEVDTPL